MRLNVTFYKRLWLGTQAVSKCWQPFHLNPGMPLEEIDRLAYLTVRFGNWEKPLELEAHVAAVGEPVGTAGTSRDCGSRAGAVPA